MSCQYLYSKICDPGVTGFIHGASPAKAKFLHDNWSHLALAADSGNYVGLVVGNLQRNWHLLVSYQVKLVRCSDSRNVTMHMLKSALNMQNKLNKPTCYQYCFTHESRLVIGLNKLETFIVIILQFPKK
jgi:hypothetical protein